MTRLELIEYWRKKQKEGVRLHGEALELIIDADLEEQERQNDRKTETND